MQAKFKRPRRIVACTLIAASTLTTLVLAGGGAGAASAATHASKPAPAVFLFPSAGNDGILAYADKTGILQSTLAKVNATAQFGGTYTAGSEEVTAFNAGALNVEGGANSVIVGAIASGLKATIVAETGITALNTAIVVPANSPIKNVKELAGHSVAVNQNGHGEYELLLALQDAGVPFSKVTREYLPTGAAAAAFATGQLQAWVPFATLLTGALKEGARVVEYEGQIKGDDDDDPLAISTAFVKAHPTATAALVNLYIKLSKQEAANPVPFENVFTSTGPTSLSGSSLTEQYKIDRSTSPYHWLTATDRTNIQNIANFFFKNGLSLSDYNMSAYVASPAEEKLLESETTSG
jgi:sulfonate transport system substrate-binding protein